jgi:hypothetical protein
LQSIFRERQWRAVLRAEHEEPQAFATDELGQTDVRLSATAFLINKQAGGGAPDPNTALLVVIGVVRSGTRILASTRLEIELSCQSGT